MRWMSANRQSLAPVLNSNGILMGIVTDGDIRRGLLRGLDVYGEVTKVMNEDPFRLRDDLEEHEIASALSARRKMSAPVVSNDGRYIRTVMSTDHIIPNCVPHSSGLEQKYLSEAVNGGWYAVGPAIQKLEESLAAFCGAEHAIAVSSGTAALHLALRVAGVGAGDRVLMPTFTFVATANAVRYCGAEPVFFDVDAETMCLDTKQVAAFLEDACEATDRGLRERTSGARIGAILPVHIYGHACDQDALKKLGETYGIPIVDDLAEALGGGYRGRPLGSVEQLCALSFNGNKVITGGSGGMVLTQDSRLASRVRLLASQAKIDTYEFEHGEVGYNYRMPNVVAAVALAQAATLEERLARKRAIADRYADALSDLEGCTMWAGADWADHARWMSVIKIDEDAFPGAVRELRYFMYARGIETRPVWLPLHRQAPFAACQSANIQVAEDLHRRHLCLPCSVGLTEADQSRVVDALTQYFRHYRLGVV